MKPRTGLKEIGGMMGTGLKKIEERMVVIGMMAEISGIVEIVDSIGVTDFQAEAVSEAWDVGHQNFERERENINFDMDRRVPNRDGTDFDRSQRDRGNGRDYREMDRNLRGSSRDSRDTGRRRRSISRDRRDRDQT